jgi:hypothetical protein
VHRRALLVSALALALALVAFVPVVAQAGAGDPPCPPGTNPNLPGLACVFVDKLTTGIDAQTQAAATEQAVAAQESGWLGRALELQHHLGDALPFRDAMWVGTHNSFNTVSNVPPSLSNLDSNQNVSLVDQLRLGVRGIEVDVHWMPSVWAGGANAPVVCHGQPPSNLNFGCTDERLLDAELAPVGAWLREPANRDDVVLMYIEDNIDDPAGFASAAQMIESTIGDLVYTPPSSSAGCPLLPLGLRRADVLAAGKHVVIMSGCGPAGGASGAWRSTVFDDSVRAEDGNPQFAGYPACTSPSVPTAAYGSKLVRFFEDSTFVSAAVGLGPGPRLTVDEIADMVRCGVNLFGLDQLTPNDPRLDAMVWSWAPDEPASSADGTCALVESDGRFHAAPCDSQSLPYACVTPDGTWTIAATSDCSGSGPGARFAVPGSGHHQQELVDAMTAAGVTRVWVA